MALFGDSIGKKIAVAIDRDANRYPPVGLAQIGVSRLHYLLGCGGWAQSTQPMPLLTTYDLRLTS